ncbi:MAG TPA: glycosyltransferase [Candidatus Solibacter sp.]
MKLSVVIISRNEGAELRRTLESLRATVPPRSEIVIVDDRSTDGSTRGLRRVIKANGIGVARARNLGVSKTTGDLLFFADAHIRLEKRWWQPLAEVLEDRKVAAVAPAVTHLPATRRRGFGLTFTGPDLDARWLPRQGVTPFSAPILPGCSLMMRRATFDAVGGWDGGLLHRGGVDNEMSVRLWLLGYELMVAPQVVVPHLFRSASPYPVGWPQYLHNRLRLAFVHLNAARLAKVVKALHKEPAFGDAMELLVSGDISARRRELLARRARTDDWFFERFGLKW